MQFVETLTNMMDTINGTFDEKYSLLNTYIEYASSDLNGDLERAELQYISESTTDSESALDTFNYLCEEAESKFSSKVTNAIDKLMEIFDDFIKNMRANVQKFLLETTSDGRLAKIEKKVVLNPFLRGKSVTVESDDKGMKLFDDVYDCIIRGLARVKTGNSCASEFEKINTIINDWSDTKKMTKETFNATMLISEIKLSIKDALKKIDYMDGVGKEALKDCKAYAQASGSNEPLQLGRAAVRATKISINASVAYVNAIMSSLTALSKTSTGKIAADNVTRDVESYTTIYKTADAVKDLAKSKGKKKDEVTVESFAEKLFGDIRTSVIEEAKSMEDHDNKFKAGTDFMSLYDSIMEERPSTYEADAMLTMASSPIGNFAKDIGFDI